MTQASSDQPATDLPLAVRTEFAELIADFDGAAEWQDAVAAFGDYLHQGIGLDPWAEVAGLIERCLESGRPGSFVRLGDGEGNVLALGLEEYPALTQHCLRMTSTRHLGSPEVLPDAADELLPALHTTLRNATVIGFPGPFGAQMMIRRWSKTNPRPAQGLISVHRYLTRFASELELESKTGAPSGFHRGLLPHYERLIRGRNVGIVTCHEQLRPALRTRMGARHVDWRPVPRQAKFATDPHSDTRHWPHRYHELMEELRQIEPGTLWLVAAGQVGKPYCEVIRAAGGVGVDIGHAADIWVGMGTRNYDQGDVLAQWAIT
jgi:hypothetical protein